MSTDAHDVVRGRAQAWSTVTSETRKLLGLPSTWLVLTLATAASVVVGYLTLHSLDHAWSTMSPAERRATDPVADAFTGMEFTQLAFAAWAAASITGEYAHHTIDITLTASPRRSRLFWAKLLPLTLVTVAAGELAAATSFALARTASTRPDLAVRWGDPGVARSIVCAGLLIGVVSVVGFGLGALLRHTGAAVAAVIALVFLSWPVARALEGVSYLPDRWLLVNAADALVATRPGIGPDPARTPSPGYAVAVVATYVAVFLALGLWRIRQDP